MGWTNNNKIENLQDGNVKVTTQYQIEENEFAKSYSFDDGKTWNDVDEGEKKLIIDVPHTEGLLYIIPKIQGCLQMPPKSISHPVNRVTIPIVDVVSTPVVSAGCEDLSNPHEGSGSHHGYYDGNTDTVMGTVFSKMGQVETNSGWKDCEFLGVNSRGDILKGYRIPRIESKSKISLRTKEGCNNVYADSRDVVVRSPYEEKSSLNLESIDLSKYSSSPANYRFVHSSDIVPENVAWSSYYRLGLAGEQNISIGVNNHLFNCAFDNILNVTVADRVVKGDDSGGINKDYLLEIRNHTTKETYIYAVRGYSLGGHFSTVYTYTCLVSNSVFVSSYLGENDVKSYITNTETGEVYEGNPDILAGQSFYIDKGLDKDTIFDFGFDNVRNWCKIKLLNYKN